MFLFEVSGHCQATKSNNAVWMKKATKSQKGQAYSAKIEACQKCNKAALEVCTVEAHYSGQLGSQGNSYPVEKCLGSTGKCWGSPGEVQGSAGEAQGCAGETQGRPRDLITLGSFCTDPVLVFYRVKL